MKREKNFILLVAIAFTLLLTSCNSTKVLSSWSLPSAPSEVMNKVLVLGVMQKRIERENIEREMVTQLRNAGVNAQPATQLFGPKGFIGMDEEQITSKLRGSDFTSVMIVSLVDKEKERSYMPGTSYVSPRVVGYSRYYRRYIVMYDRIYTPGYYRTNVNYVLEADVYTVNDDDALIYSAQTQSWDPANSQELGMSFAKAITEDMRAKNLIR